MPRDIEVAVLSPEDPPNPVLSRLEDTSAIDDVEAARPEEVPSALPETMDCVVAALDGSLRPLERASDADIDAPIVALAPPENGVDAEAVLDAGATDLLRRDEDGRTVLPKRVTSLVERRRLDRRFEAAIEDPTAAVYLLSPGGIVERANGAARNRTDESIEGERFWELDWIARTARPPAAFRDAIDRAAAGEDVHLETILSEGEALDAEVVIRPVTEAGETRGLLAEVRGVPELGTEQDRPRLLRAIVENVPVVVFALDGEGRFTLSEGRGLEPLDLEPGELVGESVFEVYADNERLLAQCRRALAGEYVEGIVDVGETTFEAWYQPVADGRNTEVIGAAIDVTELKDRKRELERETERLERFASVVSHDLRNPLNVARASVELLDDADEATVERIENALDRMGEIVDDVLTLARTGESVEAFEAVDIAETAARAWGTVETTDAELAVLTDAVVRADEERLRRLFENLFANAVDHGEGNTTVTVGAVEDGFYVADDGSGIPEDDRDRVFESGYSTDEDGTGFGLAIVNEIVEAHGWEIGVTESDLDGTRFEITGVTHSECDS